MHKRPWTLPIPKRPIAGDLFCIPCVFILGWECSLMTLRPCLVRSGEARYSLGDPLFDKYLEFVASRARPNTLRAVAHDLKTFFAVVNKTQRCCRSRHLRFLSSATRRPDRRPDLRSRIWRVRLNDHPKTFIDLSDVVSLLSTQTIMKCPSPAFMQQVRPTRTSPEVGVLPRLTDQQSSQSSTQPAPGEWLWIREYTRASERSPPTSRNDRRRPSKLN